MESLVQKFKDLNITKDLKMFFSFGAFLCYGAIFVAFSVYVNDMLAADSAATLSSYFVVITCNNFVSLFFGFLATGSTAMVGAADAAQNYEEAGRYILWWLIGGLVCGLLATIIISITADDLINLFNTAGELNDDTSQALKIVSYAFWLNIVANPVVGILSGLLHLITLMGLSLGLGVINGLMFVLMFQNGFGLLAFSWANNASKAFFILSALAAFAFLPWYKKYKIWRLPQLGALRSSLSGVWVQFRNGFTFTSMRSISTNSRDFIAVLLATRLSVFDSAIYNLFQTLSLLSSTYALQVGSFTLLVTTRLFGNLLHDTKQEDKTEMTREKKLLEVQSLRGFVSFTGLAARVAWIWGICVLLYHIGTGPSLIVDRANPDEKEEYAARFENIDFICFLLMQPFHFLTGVYETMLIAAQDFKIVALSTVVPFLCLYLPLVITGYTTKEDLTFWFFADVCFFGTRSVIAVTYWHCVRKPTWIKKLKALEDELEIKLVLDPVNRIFKTVLDISWTDLKNIWRQLLKTWGTPSKKADLIILEEVEEEIKQLSHYTVNEDVEAKSPEDKIAQKQLVLEEGKKASIKAEEAPVLTIAEVATKAVPEVVDVDVAAVEESEPKLNEVAPKKKSSIKSVKQETVQEKKLSIKSVKLEEVAPKKPSIKSVKEEVVAIEPDIAQEDVEENNVDEVQVDEADDEKFAETEVTEEVDVEAVVETQEPEEHMEEEDSVPAPARTESVSSKADL